MKNILLFAVMVVLLAACASTKPTGNLPVKCVGKDVYVHQDIFKSIPEFNQTGVAIAAPDEVIKRWLKDKKVLDADKHYVLQRAKKPNQNYYVIPNFCGSGEERRLAQFTIDPNSLAITSPIKTGVSCNGTPIIRNAEPLDISLTKGGPFPGPADTEGYRLENHGFWFYYTHDSSHIKDKYNYQTTGKLSWKLDPGDIVTEVLQYSSNDVVRSLKPETNSGFIMLDKRDGNRLQFLISKNGAEPEYLDLKTSDNGRQDIINLKNLEVIKFLNRGDGDPTHLLKILDDKTNVDNQNNADNQNEVPSIKMPLNKQLKRHTGTGPIRYVDWDNYKNGFIRLSCDYIYTYHKNTYDILNKIGAIGKEQINVIISPYWLMTNDYRLFLEFQDKIQYPEKQSEPPATNNEDKDKNNKTKPQLEPKKPQTKVDAKILI